MAETIRSTVNVSGSGLLIGTYTLATYSSLAGIGSSAFVLGIADRP